MSEQKTLLIIGKVWPEPTSSAAGSRMIQLLELFLEDGWKITFSSSASQSDYSFNLQNLGIDTEPIQLNDSSFDDFIGALNPNMVLFDRYMIEEQFGWRVAENCPDAIRVLDTIDLHCLRNARQTAFKNSTFFDPDDLLSNDIAKREIASILRCDLSLIISDVEMKILKEIFRLDEALLYYLPFLFDISKENVPETGENFSERNGFVTIGNFRHEPNWNSVLWLKEEIWPIIRKQLSTAKLYVYGSYPTQKNFQLSDPNKGFLIKGRASDALEVIGKARVLLAPLRFGAGLKGKLMEAMQCGTPSVTTSIGAEGMELGCNWNGVVTSDTEQFANAAVQLHENEDFWKISQKAGFELLKNRFDKKKFAPGMIQKIHDLKENLETHRQQNFIGSMLRHHTMNSTKFMSRWIEEKNKS